MSGSRRLVLTALCILPWGLCGLAADTSAQVYEEARRTLDLVPDPIARSPRMLGMGRLTLVDGPNNRINLWDFAANPVGGMEADSVSTFELRPATSSSAGRHQVIGTGRERQDVASREIRMGYEAWMRARGGAAYGLYGDAATLRADRPFGEVDELRRVLRAPRMVGVLNGPMPSFRSERMRYAITVFYGLEDRSDEYRTLFSTATGEYLGKKGDILGPPDFFTPNQYRVSTLGGGTSLSYRFGPWLTAAVGGQGSSSRIEGENSSVIHDTGTGEDRPYYQLQTSAVGRGVPILGPGTARWPIEWGYDGRTWTSSSEGRWVFTLKAGINQAPFTGRGKLFERSEDGLDQRFRVRAWSGNFELNGSGGYWRREIEVRPPDPLDFSSFNRFITIASQRDGADSLALPDSVRHTRSVERTVNLAYGATWKLKRGLVGLEYHWAEQKLEQLVGGEGPKRGVWDLRGGMEYRCTDVLAGRLGYIYRSDDRDLLSENNEYTSHTLTSGVGLAPRGSIWGLDLGWAIEWVSPDFVDATDPRESRQQVAARVHWAF